MQSDHATLKHGHSFLAEAYQLIVRTAKTECLDVANQFYTQDFLRELQDLMYSSIVGSEKMSWIKAVDICTPGEDDRVHSDLYIENKDMHPVRKFCLVTVA